MDGDPALAIENVGKLCDPETVEFLKKISPTSWKIAKTEAIDFDTPFLWFDDDLYDDEREELIKRNLLSSWIEVDILKNPNAIEQFTESLQSGIGE
jgi:hypothetical protein